MHRKLSSQRSEPPCRAGGRTSRSFLCRACTPVDEPMSGTLEPVGCVCRPAESVKRCATPYASSEPLGLLCRFAGEPLAVPRRLRAESSGTLYEAPFSARNARYVPWGRQQNGRSSLIARRLHEQCQLRKLFSLGICTQTRCVDSPSGTAPSTTVRNLPRQRGNAAVVERACYK